MFRPTYRTCYVGLFPAPFDVPPGGIRGLLSDLAIGRGTTNEMKGRTGVGATRSSQTCGGGGGGGGMKTLGIVRQGCASAAIAVGAYRVRSPLP